MIDSISSLGFFGRSGVLGGGVAMTFSGKVWSLQTLRTAAACSSNFLLT